MYSPLISKTVSCGVAPLLYVLAMSEFRDKVEDKLEDIWQFVTNKFTGIIRGFRVQPEVDESIEETDSANRVRNKPKYSDSRCTLAKPTN